MYYGFSITNSGRNYTSSHIQTDRQTAVCACAGMSPWQGVQIAVGDADHGNMARVQVLISNAEHCEMARLQTMAAMQDGREGEG